MEYLKDLISQNEQLASTAKLAEKSANALSLLQNQITVLEKENAFLREGGGGGGMVGGCMYVSLINYKSSAQRPHGNCALFFPSSFLSYIHLFFIFPISLSLPQGSDHPVWY